MEGNTPENRQLTARLHGSDHRIRIRQERLLGVGGSRALRALNIRPGVDVWLNNPRRPVEASGTSGMKVVLNGGLNSSILDGWWAEACDGTNGFALGNGGTHSSVEVHDRMDREALQKVIAEEVVPLYSQRDRDGLPRAWITRMKSAMRSLG